ncbi:MAG TPA: BTAD domain-containing putative transcriptional regulator, partial [Actinomycetota bacterium]
MTLAVMGAAMSNRYEERPVGPASAGGLWLQVLGPLRIWRGNVELDAGPPQQALLLAILLAREGRPVSRNELIDLIWGDDVPQTAHNVIHKYVGVIRRLMEPSLAPRATGSHLVRRGNAYLFLAEPGMLDLGVFRTSVRTAEVARSEQRHDAALAAYLDALQLWRGEAGAGLDLDPAAMPIFVGLNREFLDACVSAAEVAVSIGRPERLVAPLELAAAMAPLHEPVHASLMSILAAAGQQAEALAVHRAIRVRLVEQLGIDPGELLETTYRQVVAQPPARASARLDSPGTVVGSHSSTLGQSGLVGRERDLSLLTAAIEPAFTGASGLAVVEGEPGVGKTRLLEELDVEATRRGARVIWAHCHDGDGTPALWPWVLVVRALLDDRSHAARADWPSAGLGELLDPSTDALTATVFQGGDTQFRMFQRVVDLIGRAAVTRPLVVLLDDLQWADIATLHLYSHLLGQLPRGVAVVSALRDRAPMPGEDLARALAGVSRAPGHRRLRLAPLDLPDVAELVRNLTDVEPHPDRVRDIHMRTGGNPFFVREVARGDDVRVHSVNDAAG